MTIAPEVVIGFITALCSAITAGARFAYLEMRKDRDFWRDRYLSQVSHTNKSIDVAATVVQPDA